MARKHNPLRNYNRHHVWFEAPQFEQGDIYTELRHHLGFIVLTHKLDHNQGQGTIHTDPRLRRGIPKPDYDAAHHFMHGVVEPYELGQPRTRTLDQAIGFFVMTDNQDTAEHLSLQREYILRTPLPGEMREVA